MDNHVHLLLRAPLASISDFMQRLQTAYANYFNRRHAHVGPLFQGRFGSQCIENDDQLLAVVRYIHMNPVKAGITRSPEYEWSSYSEYTESPVICDVSFLGEIIGDTHAFRLLHEQDGEDSFLDVEDDTEHYVRVGETQARAIADEVLGESWRSTIMQQNRQDRNAALRTLRNHGLSVRQIERLTGIGRGIIQRV